MTQTATITDTINRATVKAFFTNLVHLVLVDAVIEARKLAKARRAHVDSYTAPILLAANLCDDAGDPITEAKNLHLCDDEAGCAAFYAACDRAHREQGYTMEPGYCPALTAESEAIVAENALIEAARGHFGLPQVYNLNVRARLLTVLIGQR